MPDQPQPATYIDPFVDWSFKRLFATSESKPILIGLLNHLFKGRKYITAKMWKRVVLFNLAKYANLTRKERDMYNASQKRKWDNKNVLDYAVKTAVADADKKAREEEKKEMAQKLKSQKTSIEIIAEVTGLSVEEIEHL